MVQCNCKLQQLYLAFATKPEARCIQRPMSLRIDASARAFGHTCKSVVCLYLVAFFSAVKVARTTFVYITGQCCLTFDER